MQFSPLGVSVRVINLSDYLDIIQTIRNPYYLWSTLVSFSCRHPTHFSTPCEVTFSSYLPRHMTGEHESSNQEDMRGSVDISPVKRPLSLILKDTDGPKMHCSDKARGVYI